MIVPGWVWVLWVATKLSFVALAVAIVYARLARRWPSLLAIAIDEIVIFFVLARKIPYHTYFYAYWTNAIVVALLRLWLAWDVLRSVPALRYVSIGFKKFVLTAAALIGAISFTASSSIARLPGVAQAALRLDRSVTLAWVAALSLCFACIVISGFGFTVPTMRIMMGMVLRLASALVVSFSLTKPNHASWLEIVSKAADMATAMLIALYWTFAILKSERDDSELREAWQEYLPSTVEKAGE